MSRRRIVRTPPCPSPQRGLSCFRLRAPLQARRHGPLPLLSLLRSGRGVAGPVSCGSCSLRGSHRVVMSASPPSGFGRLHHQERGRLPVIRSEWSRTAQCRTLCPDVRVRLSAGGDTDSDDRFDLTCVDVGTQRPADRSALQRIVQTFLHRVEIGAAAGEHLLRVHLDHAASRHQAKEYCFVSPSAAAGAGANRATHRTSLARSASGGPTRALTSAPGMTRSGAW